MKAELFSNYIAFLAPYPGQDRFLDGWMSRIRTIDLVLSRYKRVYLNFQDWFKEDVEPEIVVHGDDVVSYTLSPNGAEHAKLAEQILESAKFVYIHTMHQCEYILPYFDPDRMIVDIHGVVPEEELMMGSPERSAKFGDIEKEIFSKLKRAFVVTQSMARHFKNKYKDFNPDLFHLPVFDFDAANDTEERLDELFERRSSYGRDQSIYAGGKQVWQCVDQMLELMEMNKEVNDFAIFSHDEALFNNLIKSYNFPPDVFKGYIGKEELKSVYERSNFGFVLRQDTVVNRVASPTKLCDYCAAAVIPIIDFSAIGDFEEYGYVYVNVEDYREGYIPDLETQYWMAERNLQCMIQMENEFKVTVLKLHEMIEGCLTP